MITVSYVYGCLDWPVCSQPEYVASKSLDAHSARSVAQGGMAGWAGAGTDPDAIHLVVTTS